MHPAVSVSRFKSNFATITRKLFRTNPVQLVALAFTTLIPLDLNAIKFTRKVSFLCCESISRHVDIDCDWVLSATVKYYKGSIGCEIYLDKILTFLYHWPMLFLASQFNILIDEHRKP